MEKYAIWTRTPIFLLWLLLIIENTYITKGKTGENKRRKEKLLCPGCKVWGLTLKQTYQCVRLCHRIDRKMSCSQTNYKLDEAQAIFTELRSIKKAISTGEKERQDLIQVSDFYLHILLSALHSWNNCCWNILCWPLVSVNLHCSAASHCLFQ